METNISVIQEISDGNYVCKVCGCYLTPGKIDSVCKDNLHVHFNGKKHKFFNTVLSKYSNKIIEVFYQQNQRTEFYPDKSDLNLFLSENGITYDDKLQLSFYCNFCDCKLPPLSKNKDLNIFNLRSHLLSKRHHFSILQYYANIFYQENKNDDKELVWTKTNSENLQTTYIYTSVTAAVGVNDSSNVENIFKQIPKFLKHHSYAISYNEVCAKFQCNVCCVSITKSHNTNVMVDRILCHLQGRKHTRAQNNYASTNEVITPFDPVENENLKKVLKRSRSDTVINKNQIYIGLNSTDDMICTMCKCFLPRLGKGGYLCVINNFRIHFMGKKHKIILKNDVGGKINESLQNKKKNYNKVILNLFDSLPSDISKDNIDYFMISKSSNLICKICSCIVHVSVTNILSTNDIISSLVSHIRSKMHLKTLKSSLKKYLEVNYNINKSTLKNTSFKHLKDSLKIPFKIDSCGQIVCSLCHIVISLKNCNPKLVVMSHLKGKRHRKYKDKSPKILTENVLNDVINTLPVEYKVNEKYIDFIFKYGIINCNVCSYMFTAKNNYALRNNLMMHLMSAKHKKLLNIAVQNCDYYQNPKAILEFLNDGSSTNITNLSSSNENISENSKLLYDENIPLSNKLQNDFDNKFQVLVPKNLQFNKEYISLKHNEISCLLCKFVLPSQLNCTILVENLINHFNEDNHIKKVKKYKAVEFYTAGSANRKKFTERCLNKIFKHYISKEYSINRQSIIIVSKNLFCTECQCDIVDTSHSNEAIVKQLKLHFKSHNSLINSEIKHISEHAFDKQSGPCKSDDDLIFNYVPANLRFNKDHITYNKKSKTICCIPCAVYFPVSKLPESTAHYLTLHFEGMFHNLKLKKINKKNNNTLVANDLSNSHFATLSSSSKIKSKSSDTIVIDEIKKGNLSFDNRIKDSIDGVSRLKNVEEKVDLIHIHEDSDIEIKNSAKICDIFLDELFKYYIEDDFKCNRQIFVSQSDKIMCTVCEKKVSLTYDLEIAAKDLKQHLTSINHKKILTKTMDSRTKDKPTGSCNDTGESVKGYLIEYDVSNDSTDVSKKIERNFLSDVFDKFIDSNLQLHKQYFSINANNVLCNICSCKFSFSVCPESAGKKITEHILGRCHKSNIDSDKKRHSSYNSTVIEAKKVSKLNIFSKNLQNDDVNSISCSDDNIFQDKSDNNNDLCNNYLNSLNTIFMYYIPKHLQLNKQYIVFKSDMIFCTVCKCQLFKPTDLISVAKDLLDHLNKYTHQANLKRNLTSHEIVNRCSSINHLNGKIMNNNESLNKLFENHIAQKYHFNKQFLKVALKKIVCCICDCTVAQIVNFMSARNELISHFKSDLHKKKVETSTTLLDDVFENYIPQSFACNKKCITLHSKDLECIICNCKLDYNADPVLTTSVLMKHFAGEVHKTNAMLVNDTSNEELSKRNIEVKKTQSVSCNVTLPAEKIDAFLDIVFQNFIDFELQSNKPYISNNSNSFRCSICNYKFTRSARPELAGKSLMEHLRGKYHNKNLSKLNITHNEGLNDDDEYAATLEKIFKNFVAQDLQFNTKFLLMTANGLICKLCDASVVLKEPGNPKAISSTLTNHLVGKQHNNNLEIASLYKHSFSNQCSFVT